MSRVGAYEFGWRPDLADHRDYTFRQKAIATMLRNLPRRARKAGKLPAAVDWREYCGPVEDQQDLATSTAHACVGLVQYFERRSSGRLLELSRLFVHGNACRLEGGDANRSVSLRSVLSATVRCGIPPERHWPYSRLHLNRQPDAFAYSFQRDFRRLCYLRLDSRQLASPDLLEQLKAFLSAGFSIAFGFPVCNSIGDTGQIALPNAADEIVGGQAVVAVGYDDRLRIRSDKGALLVRNSWGPGWGESGYGWLPYSYVEQRLAVDFWTLMKPTWLRSGEFEMPSIMQ